MFTRPDGFRFRVGVDILQVARMARLVTEHPAILDAVFTPRESEYCLGRRGCHQHLAARFAAKEAVLKAIGTGLGRRMNWTDVEVVQDAAGRPLISLHGEVAEWARRRGVLDMDVSISHTADLAIAHVLVWCESLAASAPGAPHDRSSRSLEAQSGET